MKKYDLFEYHLTFPKLKYMPFAIEREQLAARIDGEETKYTQHEPAPEAASKPMETCQRHIPYNDKRDARIYELVCDKSLTLTDVASIVSKEFPDSLLDKGADSADAVIKAATRYARRYGLKAPPKRPRGCKPKRLSK